MYFLSQVTLTIICKVLNKGQKSLPPSHRVIVVAATLWARCVYETKTMKRSCRQWGILVQISNWWWSFLSDLYFQNFLLVRHSVSYSGVRPASSLSSLGFCGGATYRLHSGWLETNSFADNTWFIKKLLSEYETVTSRLYATLYVVYCVRWHTF